LTADGFHDMKNLQQPVLAQVIQDGLLSFFAVQVCHGNLVADLKATEAPKDRAGSVILW
jgi:hypothetical protein